MSDEDQLGAAVRKLVGQVSHWTPPRWAASAWSGSIGAKPDRAGPGTSVSGASRADLMHDLVQWMADRCAEAEGRPTLLVPRLDNDLALPDQLTVVAADLRRFAPAAVQTDAAERINNLRGAFT
ncbi:hypothetical protein AB0M46_09290 [Dactylosporangium sp. NPDC051485]|uniref:hypothetical protein n=1 Tax=Dactylosporangium sp. NPDC051485 TaxID=3154846 RepID=UPI0034408C4B